MIPQRLAVFARAPRLGKVKTRLCPPLSPEQALALHRALVEDTLERLRGSGLADTERFVYFSEPLGDSDDLAIPADWRTRLQRGADLGERLTHCFQDAFAEGVERLVVVGADSPTLPLDFVNQAFAALAEAVVVLGPARDGGYYLVGASRFVPEMFRGIDWGGALVLAQTVEALAHFGLGAKLLPAWYDIDTMADVEALKKEIETVRPLPRRVAAALLARSEA